MKNAVFSAFFRKWLPIAIFLEHCGAAPNCHFVWKFRRGSQLPFWMKMLFFHIFLRKNAVFSAFFLNWLPIAILFEHFGAAPNCHFFRTLRSGSQLPFCLKISEGLPIAILNENAVFSYFSKEKCCFFSIFLKVAPNCRFVWTFRSGS